MLPVEEAVDHQGALRQDYMQVSILSGQCFRLRKLTGDAHKDQGDDVELLCFMGSSAEGASRLDLSMLSMPAKGLG